MPGDNVWDRDALGIDRIYEFRCDVQPKVRSFTVYIYIAFYCFVVTGGTRPVRGVWVPGVALMRGTLPMATTLTSLPFY